eukprot:403330794
MRRIFRSQQSEDNSRGSMQTAESIKKAQPQTKRVAFFDVLTFGVVACVIFFNNLTQRSIIFNVVLSGALLVKVLIGVFFYQYNNVRSLRLYFLWRYIYNIFVIYPLIVILRYFTATYVLNYFLAGGITLLFEVIILLCYLKHLCMKKPIENIEDIPGFQIKQIRDELTVVHVKSTKAGDYLSKSLGKKTAERIVAQRMKEQYEINMKKNNQTKIKSGKLMSKTQQLQYRKEVQAKAKVGFNLIRSEEEIEAEIDYEEILKAKLEGSQQYMSFQDRMSRNVVNDFVLEEHAPKQKEKIQQVEDAREEMEREREKLRRAFQQKQNVVQANVNETGEDIEKGEFKKDKKQEEEQDNQRTSVKDGPSPYEKDEDVIVDHDQIRLQINDNPKAQDIPKNQTQKQSANNSDDTVKEHQEEDLEMQTDRVLFNKPPITNNSNLQKPVSHSHSNKKDINSSLPQDQKRITEKEHSTKPQSQDQKQPEPVAINTLSQRQSEPKQQPTRQSHHKDNNPSESVNQTSTNAQQEKQKYKSYQEKFEIQRLQNQKEQQKAVHKSSSQQKSSQQFSGKHAYAQNKIQKEIQRKAELKQQMEEQKRRDEEESDDSDSDGSYYSDETPTRRKQRKLAKQQKLSKQKTKKIHNNNDGDSSSSLSDGEPKQKKSKQQNQNQLPQNNSKIIEAAVKNPKQVRFDENKNTVKQLSSIDNGTANHGGNGANDYGDEDEYNSEDYSD